MSSLITDEIRAKATIYHGKETCKFQTQRLLREVGLPNGLLPLEEAEECGHVEETGFVWLKQKKSSQHTFEQIGTLVSYGTEVTAYAEPTRIRKLTGVKFRKLLMWISLAEISVPSMNADKVTFKSMAGISKSFPAKAFVAKEDLSVNEKNEKKENKKETCCEPVEKGDKIVANENKRETCCEPVEKGDKIVMAAAATNVKEV